MTESPRPERAGVPQQAPPSELSPQSRLVIYLLLVSAFVVMLNETIVSVAMPVIVGEHGLGVGAATGAWLVTAFMLTMAIVIPMTGFLMRRFTTRRLFVGAMALFTVGTLLAAGVGFTGNGAWVFPVLILARVVQAAGTGIMTPLLMTTIMTLVPPHERGRMMGNISIVMAAAPVLGPLIGGVIVSSLPWHWIFVIVLPFAVVGLLLGVWKMTNVRETERVRIDLPSVLLSAVGFGGLIYGLSEFGTEAQMQLTPEDDHVLVAPWIPVAVGLVALTLFLLRQRALQRIDDALIDLRVFASAGFARAILVIVVMNLIMFGSLALLPYYIQDGLGLEPWQSALVILPGGLLMGFAGPFVGALYDRFGPKPLVIPGAALVTVALALMAVVFGDATPWWAVTILYAVMTTGLALQFGPLFTAALGSLQPRFYSYGSATLSTLQQLAGAAGTSAFIVLFTFTAVASLADAGATSLTAATDAEIAHAYVAGTRIAFAVGAVVSIATIALAFFIRRPENETPGIPRGH